MDDETSIVEEYKSLRQEIMKRQSARQVVLGFTVTGVGAVIKATLGHDLTPLQGFHWYALALISFALVIIIAALLLTIHHTQQIDVISGYIRKFIEPNVKGLRWESRWTRYRESVRSRRKGSSLPLGTSKPLALFYSCLIVGIFSLCFVTGLHRSLAALCWLVGLMLFSLSLSANLYLRRTKGWKTKWDEVEK